ncbi:MAG TPA: hypothetical protein VJL29_15685 [Thermoguttaceae bacterium]|nr:hypothetical protein [Thermoguttaceae bacterium]
MKSKANKPRRIVLRTAGEPEPARRPEAVPVVVELHSDGFVQVFGPRHVRPVIVDRFDDSGPPEIQADMATLADLYHELELPRLHRLFYWPVHVLAVGMVRRRTPEGERRRQESLSMIRECASIHTELLERQKGRVSA